jgi:tRNA G46 methylase TrmB
MKRQIYTVNDLPQYSPWPARLLGLESWDKKQKTPSKIKQEFEDEWGGLLKRLVKSKRTVTVKEIDSWKLSPTPVLVLIDGQLSRSTPRKIHRLYLNLIEKALKKYLPASCLIELGSGYGSLVLSLAQRRGFQDLPILAAEYTQSGQKLLRKLGIAQKTNITTGSTPFVM